MPDFPAMYRKLFRSQTAVIEILQKAQQDTEQMFIDALDPELTLIDPGKPKPDEK